MLNKVKKHFDQERCEVTDGKRLAAYLLDWFVGSLAMMLPVCLLWLMKTHDLEQMKQADLFIFNSVLGKDTAMLAGVLGVLGAVAYYVLIPWKYTPGQTFGKRMMGIKIVNKDDSEAGIKVLLVREIAGVFFLEGVFYSISGWLRDLLSLSVNLNFTGILMWFAIVVSLISIVVMFLGKSRRMLHDYIAHTKLVMCEEGLRANMEKL